MKIFAKVKPNSKEAKVEKFSEDRFVLRVRAPAKEGKANEAVIELLSGYFNIPKSRILITRGHKIKDKVIEIYKT